MDPRASLPSVDRLLADPTLEKILNEWSRKVVVTVLREEVEGARSAVAKGSAPPSAEEIVASCGRRFAALAAPRPLRVINATGVVIHTNLGRAPLSPEAVRATAAVAGSYSTLEYDLGPGKRGQRSKHVADLLGLIFPGKAALVVNNNAAAILLVLNTLALGKEVVISRGELIEIGGSFRIPEILSRSGASLHEVGTTNRTHARDYEAAIGADTGMVLKVWPSNYRVIGFTAEVPFEELATIGHARGVPVVADQGCGRLFRDSAGPDSEPSVEELLAAGADLVCFSGDKMLGGPQAGVIVGDAELVARCAKNPLTRALRPDKMTLAALATTCQAWMRNKAVPELPAARMLEMDGALLREQAESLAAKIRERFPELSVELLSGSSRVGGGAAPEEELPTWLVAFSSSSLGEEQITRRLREADPPVIVRTIERRVVLDPRTLLPGEAEELLEGLSTALA